MRCVIDLLGSAPIGLSMISSSAGRTRCSKSAIDERIFECLTVVQIDIYGRSSEGGWRARSECCALIPKMAGSSRDPCEGDKPQLVLGAFAAVVRGFGSRRSMRWLSCSSAGLWTLEPRTSVCWSDARYPSQSLRVGRCRVALMHRLTDWWPATCAVGPNGRVTR